MYIDKPMQGHGLMQAIARVNRVYKDKPGGLIVDYLGLAYHLQKALAAYTDAKHPAGDTILDQQAAVNEFLKRYEICSGLFMVLIGPASFIGTPDEKLGILPLAQEFILPRRMANPACSRLLQRSPYPLPLPCRMSVPSPSAMMLLSFRQSVLPSSSPVSMPTVPLRMSNPPSVRSFPARSSPIRWSISLLLPG